MKKYNKQIQMLQTSRDGSLDNISFRKLSSETGKRIKILYIKYK